MIKKFNCYTGSTILGYRFNVPSILSQAEITSAPVMKPYVGNERGISYNCDKKLLKTNYRKRKKTQLPRENVVVTIK